MATDFFYTVSSAGASLPYSNGLWEFTGGFNSNSALQTGGGRAGPATHDDDTSRGTGFSNGAAEALYSFNIDWPSPMMAYNGFLSLGYRHKQYQKDGAGSTVNTGRLVMSNLGGTLGNTVSTVTGGTEVTSYVTYGPIDISAAGTYRPSGGSWVLGDFDDAITMFPTIGMVDNGGGGNLTHQAATSVWGQITYLPPGGGLIFLLSLAGLGALPFVGAMADFTHFRRYLSWRRRFHPRHTILTSDEVQQAWDQLKAYRRPTFFFPWGLHA